MAKSAGLSVMVVIVVLGLGQAPAHAVPERHAAPHESKAELAKAVEIALQRGFDAKLPPHISTLLGVAREQECPVKQGVLRGDHRIQGLDVSVQNHEDVILFVIDETTGDQDYYLTSPSGKLRKMVAVRDKVGRAVRPSQKDLAAFQKEKEVWEKRVEPAAARK